MLTVEEIETLLPSVIRLAVHAGEAVLAVYGSEKFVVQLKSDSSPLTQADIESHNVITAGLATLSPDVPILSEEGCGIAFAERSDWSDLWLVDPLDGTKEFLKRNGEFTVNIALVQREVPVLGVVLAPVLGEVWFGVAPTSDGRRCRAWKCEAAAIGRAESMDDLVGIAMPLHVRLAQTTPSPHTVTIVASRTHMNEETRAYIDAASAGAGNVELVSIGSSLKFCFIAEGRADFYPRFAPTSEWDTAAGHAVIRAAGGEVYRAARIGTAAGVTGEPLHYNKQNLLNPWFVAMARGETGGFHDGD
jgi:3'(2'), 5'-bisphosphate nucleotidase